jgi:signal transduction histidine kinase
MPQQHIRLSDFIVENMESILQAWEDFARTIEPPALTMDDEELRDHARQMLVAIAGDLNTPQSSEQQSDKAQGKAPRRDKSDTAAETHAEARLLSGYTVVQLVSEYRALRSSVLSLWSAASKTGRTTDMDDVTRFNEAVDQALTESVARYEHMVKQSQNMFLAILGHDLRNPLGTVVTGASFIMQAVDIPAKYILVATRMFNSGQRMNKLIGDLIDYTRTHLGAGLPIRRKPGNLAWLCTHAVNEVRTWHPERIIELVAPESMEVVVDEDRVAQVLSNLIGNAVQHGNGDVPVTVTLTTQGEDALISVHNLGPAIEPKKLAGIFEPLVRLSRNDASDYTERTSLGIGLFIAREIVLAHGGEITVESSEAAGTTFTVRLPRLPASFD